VFIGEMDGKGGALILLSMEPESTVMPEKLKQRQRRLKKKSRQNYG